MSSNDDEALRVDLTAVHRVLNEVKGGTVSLIPIESDVKSYSPEQNLIELIMHIVSHDHGASIGKLGTLLHSVFDFSIIIFNLR